MKSRTIKRLGHARWLLRDRLRFIDRQIQRANSERVRRAIARTNVVSFDVFDTALYRCVPEPADVFEIAGQRLIDRGAILGPARGFRDERIDAETRARNAARRKGEAEVTLDEIYKHLAERLPKLDVSSAQADETRIERAVCIANADIRSHYKHAQSAGKRIVFISDTYFPQTFVETLLDSAGYAGPHKVYLSCEYRATKDSHQLFDRVARAENVLPSQILHIGDNLHADVAMARASGVVSFWYKRRVRPVQYKYDVTSLQERVVSRTAAVLAQECGADTLRALGLEVIGPLFLGFTQWLLQQVKADKPDLLLFLARDGAFLREIFERLLRNESGPSRAYFMSSRRALNFPTYTSLDDRAVLTLCANNASLPVSEFFSRINIDIAQYPHELASLNLTADTRVHSEPVRDRLKALFRLIEPVVLEKARAERPLLVQFLAQTGVLSASHVALVDVGWGGTMQDAIAAIVADEGHETRFTGYYVGTDPRIKKLAKRAGKAYGYLTDAGKPDADQILINFGYWLIEIASSADHGTTLGYRLSDNGAIDAVLHDFDAATPNAQTATALQHAALELVDRWAMIFEGAGPTLSRHGALARLKRFVEQPTLSEARTFGDLIHVAGLGTTVEETAIARPLSLAETLRRPRAMLTAYREAHWPVAFLQRVFHSNRIARGILSIRTLWRRSRAIVRDGMLTREADMP